MHLLLFSFFRWENWNSGRLRIVLNITWVVSDSAQIWSLAVWIQNIHKPYCHSLTLTASYHNTQKSLEALQFMTLSPIRLSVLQVKDSICGILSTQFGPWNSLNKWKKKEIGSWIIQLLFSLLSFCLLIVLWVWPPKRQAKECSKYEPYIIFSVRKNENSFKWSDHMYSWKSHFFITNEYLNILTLSLCLVPAYHYLPESSLFICLNLRCLGLPPRAPF